MLRLSRYSGGEEERWHSSHQPFEDTHLELDDELVIIGTHEQLRALEG